MKLCYIDRFSEDNTNYYWLKWFEKAGGDVVPIDIRDRNLQRELFFQKPDHLHLGGSVKDYIVQPDWIRELKEKFKTRVTCFYGDVRPMLPNYQIEIAKRVDKIYFANHNYVREVNAMYGREVAEYLVHPADPEVFKPHDEEKRYDVIFIGNRWNVERGKLIGAVGKQFDLMLFGSGWGDEDNESRSVYGERFAKECSRAKIAIGQMESQYHNFEACFSCRVIETMSCETFFITHYTPRLEEIFKDGHHLAWYKTEEELLYWIKFYLEHDKVREKIAKQGREYVIENFNYEKTVKRILND